MKFRINVADNWKTHNLGLRTLHESIMSQEVLFALKQWTKENKDGVLIGGLAYSHWCTPRFTQDVDILFLTLNDKPQEVRGFKKIRNHSFQCNKTHVEIEVLDSDFLNIPHKIVEEVFRTSIISDNTRIASRSALIALKLMRFSRRDQADIEELKKSGEVDLSNFDLTDKQIENYNSID